MKAITKRSPKEHVKLLQGLLNIYGHCELAIDGSFGPATKTALLDWQRKNGLAADGSCGNATFATFGVLTTDNNTLLWRIPLATIGKQAMETKIKKRLSQKAWNLNEGAGYNFLINGGMFDTRSGMIVQDTIEKGKLINGGNYASDGIAFRNDRTTGSIYPSTTYKSAGKAVDFIGGAPSLLPTKDVAGLSGAYLYQKTKWNMIGCDEKNFYYLTSVSPVRMETMEKWAKHHGVANLINLDGGGSRFLSLCGSSVFATDGRGIPQVIGLRIGG